MQSHKSWGFTDFNLDEDIWIAISNDESVTRMVVGLEECPTTSRLHFQGSITFRKSVRKNWILKRVEECYGDADGCTVKPMHQWSNEDALHNYSGKEGNVFVCIDRRHQGKSKEYDECIDRIKKGEIDRIGVMTEYTKTYVNRHAGLDKLLQVFSQPPARPDIEVRWFYGVSGAGKTHTAAEEAGPHAWYCPYNKLEWFDSYAGQENVVINELSADCNWNLLLQLLDKVPLMVPVKGSSVPWKAKKIWITKMEHPLELFKNLGVDLYQITRRCTEIREFSQVYKVNDA